MTNLTPNIGWDDVPQLETTTKAQGGVGGPMNLQAQALLNRTEAINADGWVSDKRVAVPVDPDHAIDSAKLRYAQAGGLSEIINVMLQAKLAEMDVSPIMASVSAIKARAHGMGAVGIKGQPGTYTYTTDDFSATAAMDTLGGAVIKSDVLPGYWVKTVTFLTPQDFGIPFSDSSFDAAPAIAVGLAVAASLGARWHWRGQLYVSTAAFAVPGNLPMTAENNAAIYPLNAAAIAAINTCVFDSIPGQSAIGPQYFPSVFNFANAYAVKVRGNLRRLYFPLVNNNYGVVQFSLGESGDILDSIVEVNQSAGNQVGVNFNAYAAGSVMQGTGLRFNFMTNTTYPVWFSGTIGAGAWDTNFAEGNALDMTAANASGAVLHNTTGTTIPTFRFTVTDWFGGIGFTTAPYTKFADGLWQYTNIQIHAAGWSSNANIGNCLPANTLKTFRVKQTQVAGTQKFISSANQGVANFTNGVCSFQTDFQVYCRHKAADAAIAAGAKVSFYAYNVWGDSTQNMWRPSVLNMDSRFALVSVTDNSSINQGEIIITLNNISASAVGAADVDACVLGFSHA